jgi:hypothetical protein
MKKLIPEMEKFRQVSRTLFDNRTCYIGQWGF